MIYNITQKLIIEKKQLNTYKLTTRCMIGDADGYSNNTFYSKTTDGTIDTFLTLISELWKLSWNEQCDIEDDFSDFVDGVGIKRFDELDNLIPGDPQCDGRVQRLLEWNLTFIDSTGLEKIVDVKTNNGLKLARKNPA